MTRDSSDTWHSLARALLGDPELTSVEVAQLSGVSLEECRRLWRALGFPPVAEDARVFTRSDVVMLGAVSTMLREQGMAPEVMLRLTRATGQSLSRVAEAQIAATAPRLEVIRSLEGEPRSEKVTAAIQALVLGLEPFVSYVWRRHLLAALLRFAASTGEASEGNELAVGFADLVGFTGLSQELNDVELAAMVDRFEAVAYEHIPERGGRVVKMIGDEVMFACADAGAAAEIGLALVEAFAAENGLPEARVGLAMGPTLSWEGDLFGPTVNLASRLVNLARPSTVLVSDDLGARLREVPSYALRRMRFLRLKGIGRVSAWVLRRAEESHAETPRRQRLRRGP